MPEHYIDRRKRSLLEIIGLIFIAPFVIVIRFLIGDFRGNGKQAVTQFLFSRYLFPVPL
jgi:hypothetical protein